MFKTSRQSMAFLTMLGSLNVLAASGHAPIAPLPLHHVLALPVIHRALPTVFRNPGLSGSSSALLLRNKLLAQTGFTTGFNTSAQQAINGQISSGQLIGTFYESGGNSNYIAFQPYVLAFGNNSLNTMGGTLGSAPSSIINSIVGQGSFIRNHNTGLISSVASLPLSGAARATQLQIKNVVRDSVAAGEKSGSAAFNSPIAGGQFYGTDYVLSGRGLTYFRNATYIYSFGSDSLNNAPASGFIPNNSLMNYIKLANGKIETFGSGLVPATGYFAGSHVDNNWIFSLGKNPYNYFLNFGSGPTTISFPTFPNAYLLK